MATCRFGTKKTSVIITSDGRVLNKSGWVKPESVKALADKYGYGPCVVRLGYQGQRYISEFTA